MKNNQINYIKWRIFIMTTAARIRRIRMMEKMEQMNQTNNRVVKTEDGTMKYYDREGNVMIEAKMTRTEA
jgi:hypothetical protein